MTILTDDEISNLWLSLPAGQAGIANDFARAIEAAIIQKIGEPFTYHHNEEGLNYENHCVGNVPLYRLPEIKK